MLFQVALPHQADVRKVHLVVAELPQIVANLVVVAEEASLYAIYRFLNRLFTQDAIVALETAIVAAAAHHRLLRVGFRFFAFTYQNR
jgi:hypothetical protein